MAAAKTTEVDYTKYAHKEPTDLQARAVPWILGKTGYNPANAKTKAMAFEDGVRLAIALRMEFQRSPENQEVLEAARVAADERKAAPKEPRAPKAAKAAPVKAAKTEKAPPPAKAGRKAAKAAAPVAEPEEDLETVDLDAEEPAAAPTPAPARRGRPPAKRARAAERETAPF